MGTPAHQLVSPLAPDQSDDAGRWTREVNGALAALPARTQTFIRLSYSGGLRHADIAEQSGVSILEVSSAIATGMQQLARILEANNPVVTNRPIEATPVVLTMPTRRRHRS